MESSEQKGSNISEAICPTMLIFGKQVVLGLLDVVLSEYPDKAHNVTNLIFMTSHSRTLFVVSNCQKAIDANQVWNFKYQAKMAKGVFICRLLLIN